MTKTKRNIIIIVGAVVATIGIVLAIVLPIVLRGADELYTVTFNSNGGSAVESIVDVKHNSLINKPADPTKLNHTFDGWYKDVNCNNAWKFESDRVTGNITLYAKWTYNETVGLNLLLNGNEYTVAGIGDVTDEDIVIPETHNGLPVTTIAQQAFANVQSIKTVYIPSNVKDVKSGAFRGCGELVEVTLPDTLTAIESNLFYHCAKLVKVNIPDSVISIGDLAFSGCIKLTEVNLPAKLNELGENVFSNCIGIEKLTVDFGNAKYTSRADGRERNCVIEAVEQKDANGENITVNKVVVGCKSTDIPAITGRPTVIGSGAFYGCSELTRVDIPNGVIEIEEGAFNGCIGLTQVVIPASVVSIGERAFSSCEALMTVEFRAPAEDSESTGIQELGQEAFAQCFSLTAIHLPASLTSVGAGLLVDCDTERMTVTYGDDVNKLLTLIQAEKDGNDDLFTTAVRVSGTNGSSAIVNGLA